MVQFGNGLTVTTTLADVVPQLAVFVNVYVPLVLTVIVGVVAPVLHTPPFVLPESVTLPPTQKDKGPFAEITGVMGRIATSTILLLKLSAPAFVKPRPINAAFWNK